jgi:predicted DNA-binding WGR domain protein
MKKLRLVNTELNKFYDMEQVDGETFKVTWGRLGAGANISASHLMKDWDEILNTKKSKGYAEEVKESAHTIYTQFDKFVESISDEDDFTESELDGFNVVDRVAELQKKYKEGNL